MTYMRLSDWLVLKWHPLLLITVLTFLKLSGVSVFLEQAKKKTYSQISSSSLILVSGYVGVLSILVSLYYCNCIVL